MGWMTRFEPATSGSTDRRSNQLSYIHHKLILYFSNFSAGLANALAVFISFVQDLFFEKSRQTTA